MHIYRLFLSLPIICAATMSGAYDPTEFVIKMIYIHGETTHPFAQGTEHARALWFAWNHASVQKKSEQYFIKRYIKMHDRDVFESYYTKNRLPVSGVVKERYQALCKKARVLFAEIALFVHRADGGLHAWGTALLQAAGIPLVEGSDVEIASSSSDYSDSVSGYYTEEYCFSDEWE